MDEEEAATASEPHRRGHDPAFGRPRGTAKDRALRLLGVRWRSREELRRRLRAARFDDGDIQRALADLERVGLVDDERFAREAVKDQATRRLAGDRAIRAALRRQGVASDIEERALLEAGEEEARARALAAARAPRLRDLSPESAYRRLYGLLLRRGYSPAVARSACRAALQDRALDPQDE